MGNFQVCEYLAGGHALPPVSSIDIIGIAPRMGGLRVRIATDVNNFYSNGLKKRGKP